MLKRIKAAAAVLNQTPLDWEGNLARIRDCLAAARERGVTLICFPELCITGYGCEDMFHAPHTSRTAWMGLREIASETKGMIVSVGLPVFHHHAVFNVAALLVDGKIAGLTAKQFLAGDGIHYEPRWFKSWPAGVRNTYRFFKEEVPIGDIFYDINGLKIGFEVCEDAWVANRPGAELARKGCDIICNPSASHFAFEKIDIRRRFVTEGSRAFGVSYIYTNMLGNESGRAIYDGGGILASQGRIVSEGRRLSLADWQLAVAVIDVETARMSQARVASYRPNLDDHEEQCVRVPFDFPDCPPEPGFRDLSSWECSPWRKEEEFTHAVTLALLDYLRKSRSRGFVVSLSGGADSAACAVLCGLMVKRAVHEVGANGLRKKLSYMADQLAGLETPGELTRALLTTAYQATSNSSETTCNAAHAVAAATGADHHVFDVEGIRQLYTALVEGALGRELTWEQDDIALQNIQSRIRAPSIWMFANIRGALLLSTSNRSEAAVGYATMDGDTSGGLSPIAGIDKAFLRRWLHWMETEGPAGLGPMPELRAINEQQPTAELRPLDKKQTDEEDLMPYDLLDAVERAAIRDKLAPEDVYQVMRVRYPQHSEEDLLRWVTRFFQLWSRNQWKRERYAPSFHLDDENLDPKTWCRFPILSGGFRQELEELRRKVQQ